MRSEASVSTWRRAASARLTAVLAVVIAVVTLTAAPAQAVTYPSWDDVQKAKSDEKAKQEQITNIQNLIQQSQDLVAQTQAVAEQRGSEYQAAQEQFDQADTAARALQEQADKSLAESQAATARAGLLAAQLYRSGGADLEANILLEGDQGSDELLSKLGRASKLAQINSGVYSSAIEAKNAAQALSSQAQVARDEREKLRVVAEQKLAEAAAASQAAEEQLAQQEQDNIVLSQQLAALQDATAQTVQQYEAGVAEQRRLAALAKASNGPSSDRGQLSAQGWAVPAQGRITDNFGPRPDQPAGANAFHRGTDIGTGCSAPIYAATAGVVRYAGLNGTYGNWILIDHGDGISTGYAHIRAGGIFVSVGESVAAGQNIASSGSTGASTGCHLHFEVRIDGSAVNAVPFMRDRGAALG